MNQRIRQLIEQAEDPEHGFVIPEKLAELLIRECAAEADKQTIYCRGIPWGLWIKEHFGVES